MQFKVLIALVFAGAVAGCANTAKPESSKAVADADASQALETAKPADGIPVATTPNPLLQASSLPYQLPPFDKIEDGHFVPAFEAGMAEQLAEINAIVVVKSMPSFENTILALERSGATLTRVTRVFFNLNGADTNPARQAIAKKMAPALTAHQDAIFLNDGLFQKVDQVYRGRKDRGLDAEAMRLVEQYHLGFVRAGAQLGEADKETLRGLNKEIASLSTTFQQNLLADTNDLAVVVDSKDELAGLPDDAVAAAAEAAKARDLPGKYVFTLGLPTSQPPLSQLENRALRERIHKASIIRANRGNDHDNKAVLTKMAKLRAERAKLLGYDNHAAFSLGNQTAKTTKAVNDLLAKLAPAAVKNAKREAADIQALIDGEGDSFKLAAWDWPYFAEKVRQDKYAFNEAQMKPYFEIDRVLKDGIFYMARRLYGLSFVERTDLPVYHPDVRVFEVFDLNRDGGAEPLGLFLFDPYARPSKRGGAWMNSYVDQSHLLGLKPVVGNHLNIPKPPEGEPTLLTFSEVNTAFHEFGHAAHGLFSDVQYPFFSGTSVPRDFVEYPSQVHEMWAVWPEVLANYARHHETGEPMPQELVDKFLSTQQFNEGYATTEYLAASLLDQAWHQLTPEQIPDDAMAFERAALAKAGVDFAPVPPRYRSTYFAHVFAGGYSAGYYAYIWSEVLDADSVEWFKENGGLTRKNGDHFRKTLLSQGGSREAMALFRSFRGREPSIDPLLERRGLN